MFKDLLRWWYTNDNGVEYMTFFGCSHNDMWVVVATGIMSLIVCVLYFQVALESFKQMKDMPDSATKSFLKDLLHVFVFCAVSGYGYNILSSFINPYKFRVLLLIILSVWSYRLVKSLKKGLFIRRLFNAEKGVTRTINRLSERLELESQENIKNIQKFSDLDNIPLNEAIYIFGCIATKIKQGLDSCKFITYIPKEFILHEHLDFWENCKVIQGEMTDDITGNVFSIGESAIFEVGKPHFCKSTGNKMLVVEVDFYKTKPKK